MIGKKGACDYYTMIDFEVCKYCGKVTINLKKDKGEKTMNKEGMDLILKIVNRGYPTMEGHYKSRLDMIMDIEAAHENCPLDLEKLLNADDPNFYHDIIGIFKNLDRKSKILENCFVPRMAK